MTSISTWTRSSSRAYMPYPDHAVAHAPTGPLAGLSFTVKDMFDVEGYPTSAGSPTMLAVSGIKSTNAAAVQLLLDAGARFDGKVVTDELAYSVIGENSHFGTPVNGAAPDRYAGGSSSGSASSVSCGLCDFSLGTDSGGSVRGPAAQCGLFGLRPSWGRLSLKGCRGLCPPYDTAGIMTADAEVFQKAAKVLVGADQKQVKDKPRLLVALDVLKLFGSKSLAAFEPFLRKAQEVFGPAHFVNAAPAELSRILVAYQALQAREVWRTWSSFIQNYQPQFGPGVKERFAKAFLMRDAVLSDEEELSRKAVAHLEGLLSNGGILILPTLPDAALKLTATDEEQSIWRTKISASFCLGGLAGVPWATLPIAQLDGAPFGISLVSERGADVWLLEQCRKLVAL